MLLKTKLNKANDVQSINIFMIQRHRFLSLSLFFSRSFSLTCQGMLHILLRDFVIKIHGSRKIIVRTKFPQSSAEITYNVFPSAVRVKSAPVFFLRLIRDLWYMNKKII